MPVGDLAQLGQLPPLSPVGKVSMFAVVQMAAVGLRCGFGNDCGQPLASIALLLSRRGRFAVAQDVQRRDPDPKNHRNLVNVGQGR